VRVLSERSSVQQQRRVHDAVWGRRWLEQRRLHRAGLLRRSLRVQRSLLRDVHAGLAAVLLQHQLHVLHAVLLTARRGSADPHVRSDHAFPRHELPKSAAKSE
jgi:hypothetical protein